MRLVMWVFVLAVGSGCGGDDGPSRPHDGGGTDGGPGDGGAAVDAPADGGVADGGAGDAGPPSALVVARDDARMELAGVHAALDAVAPPMRVDTGYLTT